MASAAVFAGLMLGIALVTLWYHRRPDRGPSRAIGYAGRGRDAAGLLDRFADALGQACVMLPGSGAPAVGVMCRKLAPERRLVGLLPWIFDANTA
jgi:hypothetical protein